MAERIRPSAPDDSFAQLRAIILGPEQRTLRKLQSHVFDPATQTRDVSRVLPDALHLRAHDPLLKQALAPSVEDAITASVQRNPKALADALFPVIGPAIRKAVAHTFDAMIDSVNQTIERSVSWHALQWRWTAWRTGKPFAEVVVANTLAYRVEQVFLIHRESGLLLQHVALSPRHAADADQVSAMLTAITDFARDSFQTAGSDSLESMRVGDLAVAIVPGPHAILAAVVRGSIPQPVRETFEVALESIHRQYGAALKAYYGDSSTFEAARPLLEACLVSQRQRQDRRPSYRGWIAAAAVLLIALGVWMYVDRRDRQRWDAYVERLSTEPGVVVLASGRRGGSYFVSGLRDPLAKDPADLVVAASLAPGSIRGRWEPYEALHPPFVEARAALLLRPPAGVTLEYRQGVLTAAGSAPQQWVDDAGRLAPAIAGVRQFQFEGETAETRLASAIERGRVLFAKGVSSIAPDQQAAIDTLIGDLRQLDDVLGSSRRHARLEILGYTDNDGSENLNAALSQSRADRVRRLLEDASLEHIAISGRGLGRAPDVTANEEAQNRRTSFRVHLTGDQPLRRDRR